MSSVAVKSIKKPKINFKIDSKMADELYNVRKRLKFGPRFDSKVAGLCLLGEKDNLVDSFVPILMKTGCWDSPAVSYTEFDKAFVKMIKKDRTIIGMALIRPEGYDASLPNDFASNIRNMKNAFKDIKNTIWLVVCDVEIKTYGIICDKLDRISFTECLGGVFNDESDSKMLKITKIRQEMSTLSPKDTLSMNKQLKELSKTIEAGTSDDKILKNIDEEYKNIETKRLEMVEVLKKQKEAQKLRREKTKKLYIAQQERIKIKKQQEADGMKGTEDIGGGYFLIKDKNGRQILWKK